MIDEAGVFLENPALQREFSHYLKQAGSYGVRVIIGSQQLADLSSIGSELKANIFVSEVYGLNIEKSLDDVIQFFKLSESDRQYLMSCSRPGMCVLSVGYPYATSYHLKRVPSELEAQILFGKATEQAQPTRQEEQTTQPYTFLHPALEQFAVEQGMIMSNWITGDATKLKADRTTEQEQNVVGSGKLYAYFQKDKIDPATGQVMNQTPEHYISVLQIAAVFVQHDIPVQVHHYEEADVVAQLPDGTTVAFEYQTAGHNDPKKLMEKRKRAETKYSKMFFVGSKQACKEISDAIGTKEIVLQRGAELASKLQEMIGFEE